MGSNMSCNFAILYVGYLEKNILVYTKYMDDICG